MNHFLLRPRPFYDECLTSYICRVALENCATPHQLWRLLLHPGAHYPQSSMSAALDIYPNNNFDLKKFESMLLLEENQLDSAIFYSVFKKFGIEKDNLARSRILSGLINDTRKYCPLCLFENNYYKLIWQVKEITLCEKHEVKLLDECWNCNYKVPSLPNVEHLGICPRCSVNLSNFPVRKRKISKDNIRILEDWNYLLSPNKDTIQSLKNFSNEQSLAIKILHLVNNYKNVKSSADIVNTIKSIQQLAKNSKTTETYIHLNTILQILRKLDVSVKDFISLRTSYDFANSIINNKVSLVNQYSCIAPWCESFLKPGSLKRTATSVKKKNDDITYSYYMFCDRCATEYCLDHKTKELIERGYFINLAWEKIKDLLAQRLSMKELSKILKITEDKIKRCIIFLATNKLIDTHFIPLSIPYNHNPEMIESFESLIEHGKGFKEIMKFIKLSYNVSLYYWYLPQIRIKYLTRKQPRPNKVSNNQFLIDRFNIALKHFTNSGQIITVKNICSHMNICPETLRLKGLLSKLKETKMIQKEAVKKAFKKHLIEKAEDIIQQSLNSGTIISSEALYNNLGTRRNVIVRNYPDVTQYITKLLKECKSSSPFNVYNTGS